MLVKHFRELRVYRMALDAAMQIFEASKRYEVSYAPDVCDGVQTHASTDARTHTLTDPHTHKRACI